MNDETKELSDRIKELGEKASQLLTFLSLAFVVLVLFETSKGNVLTLHQKNLATIAMRWWMGALFFVLIGVLPWKEFCLFFWTERIKLVSQGSLVQVWASLDCRSYDFLRCGRVFSCNLVGVVADVAQLRNGIQAISSRSINRLNPATACHTWKNTKESFLQIMRHAWKNPRGAAGRAGHPHDLLLLTGFETQRIT